jgi:hypothetical protein
MMKSLDGKHVLVLCFSILAQTALLILLTSVAGSLFGQTG